MKEQKVLVKCIYDTYSASKFQDQLQTLLMEGWRIILSEANKSAIMVVLEKEVV